MHAVASASSLLNRCSQGGGSDAQIGAQPESFERLFCDLSSEEIEHLPRGLCFGLLEQVVHARDHIRNASRVECRHYGSAVSADRSQQDGHVRPRHATLIVPIPKGHSTQRLAGLGDVFRLILWRIKGHGDDIASLVVLCLRGFHFLRETAHELLDELSCNGHHTFARPEVLLQLDLLDGGVPSTEIQDVLNVTATPLVDGLVIVAHHADPSAQVVQGADDCLLNRVDILVFVNDDVTDLFGQTRSELHVVA